MAPVAFNEVRRAGECLWHRCTAASVSLCRSQEVPSLVKLKEVDLEGQDDVCHQFTESVSEEA